MHGIKLTPARCAEPWFGYSRNVEYLGDPSRQDRATRDSDQRSASILCYLSVGSVYAGHCSVYFYRLYDVCMRLCVKHHGYFQLYTYITPACGVYAYVYLSYLFVSILSRLWQGGGMLIVCAIFLLVI